MADGSDTTLTTESTGTSAQCADTGAEHIDTGAPHAEMGAQDASTGADLVDSLKSFVDEHGGATAAIEFAGRRGARIVLVGEDGTWSDEFADGTDIARSACVDAGVEVQNEWERELTALMRPGNDLWRSLERRRLRV